MAGAGVLDRLDTARIAVIGLGYVGLPLAVAFGREFATTGFDIDPERVVSLQRGHDATGEVEAAELASSTRLTLTADQSAIAACNVYVVAVPTPVTRHKWPDFSPLVSASRLIAAVLKRGDLVIYESTVYPGATEEVCVPELEAGSGLKLGVDFGCGYSPERINPGDRKRRLPDIIKVTSGSDTPTAAFVDALYARIVPAGTYKASSIRVAEAAKAVENTQRDVNIALVNELALMFSRMGLSTEEVLAAAGTKWNFLPFRPGLVGGHCIGVDPYYLVHKAQEVGYHPELILAARRINESISAHISAQVMRLMALREISIVGARVLVLGLAFKEDCPDLRNTRVIEIVRDLKACNARVDVHDPWIDPEEAQSEFGLEMTHSPAVASYDAVILCVAHRQFRELGVAGIRAWCKSRAVIYDVKYVLPATEVDGRL